MSALDSLPVSLPTAPISSSVDAAAVSLAFQPKLKALKPEDFVQNGVWRDLFALTGTLRTFYGAESICKAWDETSKHLGVSDFELDVHSAQVFRAGPVCWVQAIFTFETVGPPGTKCHAIVSLVQGEEGEWRIWMLRTILLQLKGQGNVDLLETVPEESSKINAQTDHFDCVVVGGGSAGLSIGGRLQALGLTYVVLDKQQEVGGCWKTRYDSCKLHLPRDVAHLPFERTFSSQYPKYLTKNDLAQGYHDWVEKYHINVWTSSKLEKGEWSPSEKRWILKIRQGEAGSRRITCSHVVIAVGASGQVPVMPEYPNREVFEGEVLHSAHYTNPRAWKGKHGVIVGTANTGHDVGEDMLDAELAQVTMIQRSPTYVLPAEYIGEVLGFTYNATFPTDLADELTNSLPTAIVSLLQKGFLHHKATLEPERFNALERAGFKVERYGTLAHHLYERSGGHYVDVGASGKISKGLIKIKSDSLPRKYTPSGLEFQDGSTLKADVIVFTTGFENNMKNQVKEIFGLEIADQMGDCWGLDNEGELRGAYKPTGHPAMWYHGGDLIHGRYFSRFVALEIKAATMGTPLPVYGKGS